MFFVFFVMMVQRSKNFQSFPTVFFHVWPVGFMNFYEGAYDVYCVFIIAVWVNGNKKRALGRFLLKTHFLKTNFLLKNDFL